MIVAGASPTLGAISLALLVQACGGGAVIHGEVKDNFGKPVEGVTVQVVNSAYAASTDSSGKYSIEFMPGAFTLSISKAGYSSFEVKLSLAESSRYPMSPVELLKQPPGAGMYLKGANDYVPLAPGLVTSKKVNAGMGQRITYHLSSVEATTSHAIQLHEELQRMDDVDLIVMDADSRKFSIFAIQDLGLIGEIEAGPFGAKERLHPVVEQVESGRGVSLRKLSLKPSRVLSGARFCFVQTSRNLLGQRLLMDDMAPAYCLVARKGGD